MDPQILRGGFRIGVLVLGLALLMLPFQPRDSAEFVVTVLAVIVGGAFVLSVAVLARTANPRLPRSTSARDGRKGYNKRSAAAWPRPHAKQQTEGPKVRGPQEEDQ